MVNFPLLAMIKELNGKTVLLLLMISAGIMLAIVGLFYADKYLNKVFQLKRRSEVDGYVNNQYVNRLHSYISFVMHAFAIGLIIFSMSFGINNTLIIGLALIPFSFLLDIFMQWRYPVQKNEYIKTACYFGLVLILTPIAYVVMT